jgi:bifunctional non-homologous end joining protein LigD
MKKLITLYKREGSADKVYSLEITPGAVGSWDVRFRNARRGQTMKLAKEMLGLTLDDANAEFDKQRRAKTKDGYTEDQNGQAYTSSEFAGRVSGLSPQLPKPIDESHARRLIEDDDWVLQQKANGENRMLVKKGDELRGTNKKGLFVDIPANWIEECRAVLPDCEIAGEQVGDVYFAFDLLSVAGVDLRNEPFDKRYSALVALLAPGKPGDMPSFKVLAAAVGAQAKAARLAELEANRDEGGVFKHRLYPFTPGYTDTSLKYKFNESSACVVLAQNRQRSVQIGLYDAEGHMVTAGNVTIPPSAVVPAEGEVVEVEYLYYNPGGAFEQPVFLRVRKDMEAAEAVLSQITRYKPDEPSADRPRERQAA